MVQVGEVRFALGTWDGLGSSTWKVWAGTDGSVYVADRSVGHVLKVSLHPRDPARPGEEWRIAFVSAEVAAKAEPSRAESGDRLVAAWDSEEVRLPNAPLRQAVGVVLGRPSLGYQPLPEDPEQRKRLLSHRTRKVDWSASMPGVDELLQFTVLLGDADVDLPPPGTRSLGAQPVGTMLLPTGERVWVMRHVISYTASMKETVHGHLQQLVNAGEKKEGSFVRRGHLYGVEDDGFRWIMEVAATFGPIPEEIADF